jgi:hypothetical protein
MPRAPLAFLLIMLMTLGAVPATSAELTVAEQVAKVKVGRKIKVKLNNGDTIRGQMGAASADQFMLESPATAPGNARTVLFTEVQSVKPDGLTRGEKWAIFGVVWVVVGIVGKLTT